MLHAFRQRPRRFAFDENLGQQSGFNALHAQFEIGLRGECSGKDSETEKQAPNFCMHILFLS